MAPPLDVRWIHGTADCAESRDPPIQVFEFAQDTFILRQSKCLHFESPFLYLLIGQQRALLLDTGGESDSGVALPLRDTVDGLLSRCGRDASDFFPLVVAHSHGHGDHLGHDRQFADRPNTSIVPPSRAGVQEFFGLEFWPDGSAQFDLGGRRLMLSPAPGHEESHIVVYDPLRRLLLTGDTVYPGFLYIRDWEAYRATITRLRRISADHSIEYVLGAHIEMTNTAGVPFPVGSTHHPNEHPLELFPRHLDELDDLLQAIGDRPERRVLNEFILEPL